MSVFGIGLAFPQVYTIHSTSLYLIGYMTMAPLFYPLGTTTFHGPLYFFLVFGLYGLIEILLLTKLNLQTSNS